MLNINIRLKITSAYPHVSSFKMASCNKADTRGDFYKPVSLLCG